MKKLTGLLLALALCMSLTVPAAAVEYKAETIKSVHDYTSDLMTIDKWVCDENGEYHVPVGAVFTYTAINDGPFVIGGDYYLDGTTRTTVAWQYNPATKAMEQVFCNDQKDGLNRVIWDAPVVTAGTTCSFVLTQEMADSFEPFEGVLNWSGNVMGVVSVRGGVSNDWGFELATPQFIVDNPVKAPAAPKAPAFTDVSPTSPFADAIVWAVEQGITNGTTDTTFSPSNTCTTAHILTFLWRANGSLEPSIANPFSDVPADAYYTKAAVWAYEKGLISGDTFGGAVPATRAATVTYLWKLAGQPTAPAVSFTDVNGGAEYAGAVAWAVEQGVTKGTTATTFAPNATCTRGQIVTFLYRDLAQ